MPRVLSLQRILFRWLIKRETGKTALEYIQGFIVSQAKIMLTDTDKNITEIAYDLGFRYPHHLTRVFKKISGITPLEFRTASNWWIFERYFKDYYTARYLKFCGHTSGKFKEQAVSIGTVSWAAIMLPPIAKAAHITIVFNMFIFSCLFPYRKISDLTETGYYKKIGKNISSYRKHRNGYYVGLFPVFWWIHTEVFLT